jgi:hypothetical protein
VTEDGVELLGGVRREHGLEGGEGFFVRYCHGDVEDAVAVVMM